MNFTNWENLNTSNFAGFKFKWRALGSEQNRPIVFLHGFGASSSHWRFNADFFVNAGFMVYAIDLMGFGESDQPPQDKLKRLDNLFWGNQLIFFLEKIVQANKNKKVILVGNSLGSLVALTTVASRRDLVEALVASPLPDPAFAMQFPSSTSIFLRKVKECFVKTFFHLLPLELLLPLIANTPLIKIGLQAAYSRSIKDDLELFRLVSSPAKRKTAARSLRAMCIGMSLRSIKLTAPFLLDQLTRQVEKPNFLIIWGSEDKLVPLEIGKMISKRYPWIAFSVMQKTGHCPHDESHEEFNNFVLRWLDINLGKELQKA